MTVAESYVIVRAATEAHRGLGPGFLEATYQEAFEMEPVSGSRRF
jgi:hypothetical protein